MTPGAAAGIIPASLPARAYSPEADRRPAGFQNLSKPFTRPSTDSVPARQISSPMSKTRQLLMAALVPWHSHRSSLSQSGEAATDAVSCSSLVTAGEFWEGVDACNRAIRQDRDDPELFDQYGRSLALDPKMPEARRDLDWLTAYVSGDAFGEKGSAKLKADEPVVMSWGAPKTEKSNGGVVSKR